MTDDEFEQLNAEVLRQFKRTGGGQRRYPRSKKWREILRRRALYRDCEREGEFYMALTEVWKAAFKPGQTTTGILCLNCLERRLGRRLARNAL